MTTPIASTDAATRTRRPTCRVCGSTQLLPYLNLGKQPYANALHAPDAAFPPFQPLRVSACQKCHLSQLSFVAPPHALYSTYAYRSGVSEGWRAHCAGLATQYGGEGKLTVDIASNDGTMVRAFAATGAQAMGVEPSRSFDDCDYSHITRYWTEDLVHDLSLTSAVDVITAQNVLGHVNDALGFARAMRDALKPDGVAVVEVPYLLDLLRTLAFDTIYHEHLSYWSVSALRELANRTGLVLCEVQPLTVHGGSIRAVLRRADSTPTSAITPSVNQYLSRERNLLTREAYLKFSERVTARLADLNDTLCSMQPYIGFGAAAKTAVTLHCLDVRAYPEVVYDENKHKHDFCIPGTRVPIWGPPPFEDGWWGVERRPICIFAWNWAPQIIKQLRAAGYRGDIFIPAPEPRWDYGTLEPKKYG